MWPLEVLGEVVYLGNFRQAKNSELVKAMKVRAIATVGSRDMETLVTMLTDFHCPNTGIFETVQKNKI